MKWYIKILLELRQYKNDWIARAFFTHCTGEWKSAPISKQTNFFRQSSRSYTVLTLAAIIKNHGSVILE